ncbi:MAG: acyltransferase [Planctomycetaceae bacterium]|nr:acyltransferase [Planctomycetaceae bacterium]
MKSLIKRTLVIVAHVMVLPAVAACLALRAAGGKDTAITGWSQAFSLIPGTPGVLLRQAFFSWTLARCGRDACVSFGTLFSHSSAEVGNSTYIGNYCSIGDVQIDDDVLIASHVSIMNGCRQHGIGRLDVPVREQQGACEPITIGCDSWIGERATVAASVGRHCVIGAGALVLSPIPDYAVAVGVPARVIKDRRHLTDPISDSRLDPPTQLALSPGESSTAG